LHQGRIKRDHDLSLTGQLIQHRFHGAAGIEYERNAWLLTWDAICACAATGASVPQARLTAAAVRASAAGCPGAGARMRGRRRGAWISPF
jgi:hypothetical protein